MTHNRITSRLLMNRIIKIACYFGDGDDLYIRIRMLCNLVETFNYWLSVPHSIIQVTS